MALDGSTYPLDLLVGKWELEASLGAGPAGSVTFEWMSGRKFLVERWEIPIPEAPDGLAIIGANSEGDGYLQHYFDSRGVARVYKMSLTDGEWKLWRDEPDFSPLDFSQRYTGMVAADGSKISGAWEICHDGTSWEHDFDLTYSKVIA